MELGLVVRVLLVDCEAVPTEAHNTTLSPASRALERDRSVRVPHACTRLGPLLLSGMPSSDFCYDAPRGGTPHMISATEWREDG